MATSRYLSAGQAATELGIRLPTLYAYVSRGLIRSEATVGTRRKRRYYREDVLKLKERKAQRRNPAQVAAQALYWGAPVLDSALTMIADGKLYYRGHDALALASDHSIEQVAALLWTGDRDAGLLSHARKVDAGKYQTILALVQGSPLIKKLQMVLALAESDDPSAYDLRPAPVAQIGSRILRLLTLTAAERTDSADIGIAQLLQQSWAPKHSSAAHLINAALVLCADHELNVSSFTARCVASARATPYAAVIAGLSALQGTRHGGSIKQIQALFREIRTGAKAWDVLANRLQRGESIPGFGHTLYPEGDPRGRMLIQLVAMAFPRSRRVRLGRITAEQVMRLIGEHPTIDFGIVLLAEALGLPEDGALGLFALGRTVGWIAHVIEQYQQPELIRPRARYVGHLPLA